MRDCRDGTWRRRQRGSPEDEELVQARDEGSQVKRVVVVEKRVELKEVGKKITDTASEATLRSQGAPPRDPAVVKTPTAEDSIASSATERGARDDAGGVTGLQEAHERDPMSSLWQKLARISIAALTKQSNSSPTSAGV